MTFETFALSPELHLALRDMNFVTPSPIQAEAIPLLLENKDIIGQAQTGTGKTAAFAIPMIEKLDPENRNVQAVVICPTRELAIQLTEEFRKLLKHTKKVSVVSIYGGQPISRQLLALQKRPQILIGTPGRMLDHLNRNTIKLHQVNTVVLDEADEMLDMGFRDDIEALLYHLPEDRQTVLFSATMPKAIQDLARKYQQEPAWIRIEPETSSHALIQHEYVAVNEKTKLTTLTNLIAAHQLKLALVFCNTKRQVDVLSDILQVQGYAASGLHGGMPQHQRNKVMDRFRKGNIQFLVATDVAARGIDVKDIQAVFNYDMPESMDNFLHRTGRTGRAGKSGLAFTFVSTLQLQQMKHLQQMGNEHQFSPFAPRGRRNASQRQPSRRTTMKQTHRVAGR